MQIIKIILSALIIVLNVALNMPAIAQGTDGGARIKLLGKVASDVSARVTVKQIESIGTSDLDAYNPYEKRNDVYTGVWMNEFVARFGQPDVKSVTFKAIDDYEINFDPSEWKGLRILIATRVNGKYIGLEEKGPMRIVFPDYDPGKSVYQENLPKWMWMITKIEFK